MENNNPYAETGVPEKPAHPFRTFAVTVIILFAVNYFFLTLVGIIALPKWYIYADFYLNKSCFERIIESGTEYSKEYGEPISQIEDKKLRKSMDKVFIRDVWSSVTYYDGACLAFAEGSGLAYDYDYVRVCVFEPFNSHLSSRNARGLLYYGGSGKPFRWETAGYIYTLSSLGGGWYYYEAVKRVEEPKG